MQYVLVPFIYTMITNSRRSTSVNCSEGVLAADGAVDVFAQTKKQEEETRRRRNKKKTQEEDARTAGVEVRQFRSFYSTVNACNTMHLIVKDIKLQCAS